ncbi:MAG: sulfite exporter TauE/SafE family protein [Nitrospirae bacterium]|nr:sulfite exporter TauE/SafE family protein [Nitrospirota bacterium]
MENIFAVLTHHFIVSGVEINVLIPPAVAFVISFFTSIAGISGAFLLMPFQVSMLNYASPSASGTNLVYNIIAIPGGVYRFIKEGRMLWPLSAVVIAGTVPGSLGGFYTRAFLLDDPGVFRIFSGLFLLYIGARMAYDIYRKQTGICSGSDVKEPDSMNGDACRITLESADLSKVSFCFNGNSYSFSVPGLFLISFLVGLAGGAYGIGGGAIIAPFCMAAYGLPVYTIAGAALFSGFVTAFFGVIFYSFIPVAGDVSTAPDIALGALFGLGGFLGIYFGARMQRFIPEKPVRIGICCMLLATGAGYLVRYFF